jgi:hypothetical protein
MVLNLKPQPSLGLVTVILPGPDRKRALALYQYRITYRNPEPREPGCVMTWEVSGGRLPYQIAAERTPAGGVKWHCSCADAVYRGEDNPDHVCKHVHGLLETIPPVSTPVQKAA